MYNRYVPRGNGYVRMTVEEELPEEGGRPDSSSDKQKYTRVDQSTQGQTEERGEFFSGEDRQEGEHTGGVENAFCGDKSAGLKSLLKVLKLDDLDSGDLLLMLIILLLLTEGDDLDLVITLGLMLLLGLGEKKKSPDSNGLSGLLRFL